MKMYKSTRNTIASYSLFVYGCLLMLILIISFESDPTPSSYIISLILGVTLAFLSAVMAGSHQLGMHFWTRTLLLFIILTISEILIWYLVCEGSFHLKLDAIG